MNYYNEHDPKAAAWLRELIAYGHIAPGLVDERSIEDVAPAELAEFTQCHFFAGIGGWPLAFRYAGWPDDRPAWSGSCPCQPFSIGGEGKGVSDERHLWPAFKWHIAQRQPPVVFGEQVASKDGREWLAGVRLDLEDMGYAVGASDLCAASVSAKQNRPRLWWFANAAGEHGETRRLLEKGQKRGSSLSTGGLASLEVAGQWWRSHSGADRQPTLVRSSYGLSSVLRGFGNAIVPELAAQFIQACEEACNDLNP